MTTAPETTKPAAANSIQPLTRRNFLVASAAGGGLLLGFTLLRPLSRAEAASNNPVYLPLVDSGRPTEVATPTPNPSVSPPGRPTRTPTPTPASTPGPAPSATPGGPPVTQAQVAAWIRIGSDESITILVGSAEMGQGVLSSLPQIVAEELMVDWSQVRSEHAPASTVFGNPQYGGAQITAGSGSVRGYYTALRKAGAAAREMLIAAAAQQFAVSPSACAAANGKVTVTATGQSMTYGQLAPIAATLPAPADPPLTPSGAFRLIGKPMPRLDLAPKVNGRAVYGLDVKVPGMVFAAIRHCPNMGGTLNGTPATPAGAIAVVPLGNAVAVVADNSWKANRLARSLNVAWTIPPGAAALETGNIMAQAQQLMAGGTATQAEAPVGDTNAGLASAAKTIDVSYDLPYAAHACMEVLNCTAWVKPDSCDIWAPTQAQGLTAATAMRITGLTADKVTVHTTFLGGGLGRKFEQDYITQAVTVSKAVGKPVKLTWFREEDFAHDQYRPMALVRVRAGLDAANNIAAFWYRHVSPSITGQRRALTGPDGQATEGSTKLPYAMASRLIEWLPHPATVPVGYWRSVGHSINAFAVESAIDELAVAAGIDPLVFRRTLLAGSPRALRVLNAAAALGKWETPVPAGRARGIAYAESFGSHVAEVVEISQPVAGSVKVHNVAVAIDCGNAINPDQVTAQMQGGVVHALTAALWSKVDWVNGIAATRNFSNYRMLRMTEMPKIDVQIIESGEALGGVGEPGVPPLAPALANAYARLTGQRIRSLPMFPAAGTMSDD